MGSGLRWMGGGIAVLAALAGIAVYLGRWDEEASPLPSASPVAGAPVAVATPKAASMPPPSPAAVKREPAKPPPSVVSEPEPAPAVIAAAPSRPRGKDEPPPPVAAPRLPVVKQELPKPGEAAPEPPPMPKMPVVAAPPPEPAPVKEARAAASSGPPKILGKLEPAKPSPPSAAAPLLWETLVGAENMAKVRGAVATALTVGPRQAVAWSNPANGAHGFVTLTGWEDQAKGCGRFRVTRNDGERVRAEFMSACR